MTTVFAPSTEEELAALVAERFARRAPLRISGGGTRVDTSHLTTDRLDMSAMSGIVSYEPGEMTLIVRPGTQLCEIEPVLAAAGQSLAFEPMLAGTLRGTQGKGTVGGMVATNASGPRRILVGACRDALLGLRFVDGQGRTLKTGGRVMKNVTGLDLGKVLCGSHGTLAVLTEIALKTLPLAPECETLAFANTTAEDAQNIFSTALATPFEVSGAAWRDGTTWLRIEGLATQVAYRRARILDLLKGRPVEVVGGTDSRTLWRRHRDVSHLIADEGPNPLWQILLRPTAAPTAVAALQRLGAWCSVDWGGGLIWASGPNDGASLRAAMPEGHVSLIRRAGATGAAFAPQAAGLKVLANEVRRRFDPACLFNPGLMEG